MDFTALQQTLRHFAAEREWGAFHTPKNLAMALMVEAAELAEIFQWMTPEQSLAAASDRVVQEQIADEVADVLLYLLQLADHTGLDLKRAVGRKLQKNAKKHPPTRPGLPAGTAAEAAPETHVLVDWENVQPRDADVRALVPDVTDLWIFHGPNQKRVAAHHASFGERATMVPISRTGKNALDFHLSFYMGYIASRRPDARFVVLSNDKGYGPMLDHAADLGFAARAVGFVPGAAAPSGAAATKRAPRRGSPKAVKEPAAKAGRSTTTAPAKKAAASTRRTSRSRATPPELAVPESVVMAAPPPEAAASAQSPAPRRAQASAQAPAPAHTHGAAGEAAPAPARKRARTRRGGADVASAAPATSAVPATAPAPASGAQASRSPASRTKGAPEPAVSPAPAPGKRRRRSSSAEAPPGAAPAPAPAPTSAPTTAPADSLDRDVRHVQAGLRKTADKPARIKALMATIRSLLGASADADRVDAVLARLVAAGSVALDSRGGVRFPDPSSRR